MLWYILKLLVLLPLIGGMIWGSLKLSRMMQQKLGAPQGGRSVRIVETLMLSPTIRLAVLEFHGREILVSAWPGWPKPPPARMAAIAGIPARAPPPSSSSRMRRVPLRWATCPTPSRKRCGASNEGACEVP